MENFLKNVPNELAALLYRIGAVKVNLSQYYKLGTGEYSPLYCDARQLYSDLDARNMVCSRMLIWVNRHFSEIDAVVGVACGGIGWAMTLANNKQLPVLYTLRDQKDHGLLNRLEGELPHDGANVVVIDDVITTGHSALSAVEALRAGKNGKKANVLGVCSVFDWNFSAVNKKFEEENIVKTQIMTLDTLVDYGVNNGLLCEADREHVNAFRQKHC